LARPSLDFAGDTCGASAEDVLLVEMQLMLKFQQQSSRTPSLPQSVHLQSDLRVDLIERQRLKETPTDY
jgi:hypothetical protein